MEGLMSQTQNWHTSHLLTFHCLDISHMVVPNCKGDWECSPAAISGRRGKFGFGEKVADSASRLPSPPSPLYISITPNISLSQSPMHVFCERLVKSTKAGAGSAYSPLYPLSSLAHSSLSANIILNYVKLLFCLS